MKRYRIVARGLAVAAMTWLGARTAAAGTVYVDNDLSDYAGHDGSSWQLAYKTIQEGVNAAADGDIVLVAPGTYGDDQGTHVSSLSGAGANFALSGDPAETDIHGTQRVYNGTLLLLK